MNPSQLLNKKFEVPELNLRKFPPLWTASPQPTKRKEKMAGTKQGGQISKRGPAKIKVKETLNSQNIEVKVN